jgi:hypothetical protein
VDFDAVVKSAPVFLTVPATREAERASALLQRQWERETSPAVVVGLLLLSLSLSRSCGWFASSLSLSLSLSLFSLSLFSVVFLVSFFFSLFFLFPQFDCVVTKSELLAMSKSGTGAKTDSDTTALLGPSETIAQASLVTKYREEISPFQVWRDDLKAVIEKDLQEYLRSKEKDNGADLKSDHGLYMYNILTASELADIVLSEVGERERERECVCVCVCACVCVCVCE